MTSFFNPPTPSRPVQLQAQVSRSRTPSPVYAETVYEETESDPDDPPSHDADYYIQDEMAIFLVNTTLQHLTGLSLTTA